MTPVSLPPDGENPIPDWQFAAREEDRIRGAREEAYDRGFAAGRAAATPDPPHTQDCIDARFCHHAATGGDMECVCAASPDERLREAVAALPQYVITIQDREGYTYERGCEGQPMNYTGVMLADVEALVGKLKDGATTARETTNELKDAAADREKPEACRAPHCWSEYGTPCGTCPVADREKPDGR